MTSRLATLLACCLASAVLSGQAPAPAANSVDAILAFHKEADEGYTRAALSPFTAVAVQYFEPGQTVRLGADAKTAAFGAGAPTAAMADFTLDAGAFRVTPVAGGTPLVVLQKMEGGVVASAPGVPLNGRRTLGEHDVVRVGRYLAEPLPGTATGNVRVFDPEAPAKRQFTGLKWFAPDLAFQVKAVLEPFTRPEKVVIMTSRGLQRDYYRIGRFVFTVAGTGQALTVLSVSPSPEPGDDLFVPFRDATTGKESYSVGRYLFPEFAGAGATYLIDFNLATNPLCNYSPHYNCPIPPKENVLTVAIRAGERTYPH